MREGGRGRTASTGGGGAYYRPASYGGEYPATYLLAKPTRGFADESVWNYIFVICDAKNIQ